MRVLVCGSRTWDDPVPIDLFSARLMDHDMLIHGDAQGADRMAAARCSWTGCNVWSFPAAWDLYGKRAGIVRNIEMLEWGKPDEVWAFIDKPLEESRGTAHMVKIARDAGIPTYVVQRV